MGKWGRIYLNRKYDMRDVFKDQILRYVRMHVCMYIEIK